MHSSPEPIVVPRGTVWLDTQIYTTNRNLFGAFGGFRVRKNAHSILKESKINQQHQSKKQYREYRIYRYTNIHTSQTSKWDNL